MVVIYTIFKETEIGLKSGQPEKVGLKSGQSQ